MKIFTISGLGADFRVFSNLSVDYELTHIDWIPPYKDETIIDYSKRLISRYQIDQVAEFCLIGVSFGGIIAIEISKLIKPKMTILISSVETKNELSGLVRLVGKLRLIDIIPQFLLNPPKKIAQYMFGAVNVELLNSILDDTDLRFTKWALSRLTRWENKDRIPNTVKIGGTKDKLFPQKDISSILIQGGEHFMIVDKADEVSKIINEKIKTALKQQR